MCSGASRGINEPATLGRAKRVEEKEIFMADLQLHCLLANKFRFVVSPGKPAMSDNDVIFPPDSRIFR